MVCIAVLLFIILSSHPFLRFIQFVWQIIFNTVPIDLKYKFGDWAVVTGSTDGIGKEYAKELAKKDINVVLISRSIDKLRATKNEISSLNPNIQIKIIEADFSKGKDEIEKIAEQLEDIPVGILVNNVGTLTEYPMYYGEYSRTDLWNMINVNIGATALMTHMVIEKMKERGKGAIVNLSSGTDATPLPLMSFYAASKTLIRYLSDAIRAEYSRYGLTIQTLSPYYITTKMVNYNRILQGHQIIFPDAATYVKNAVNTLGKLDGTSGYWVHDIFHFLAQTVPICIRMKFCFMITSLERNDYIKTHKNNTKNITPVYPFTIITGSVDGIEKEYAKELAKKDINVVLGSRSIDKLRATKNEISLINSSIQVKIIHAAAYAKNTINTLGKLNSTVGYWLHDIIRFIVFVMPTWWMIRCSYSVVKNEQDNYLRSLLKE